MKKCPYCKEKNKDEEIQCQYCGEWLDVVSQPQQRTFVKPPKKGQSGTDSTAWQIKLQKILNEYWVYIICIAIIITVAGFLFMPQKADVNKSVEQVTKIKPQKVNAPAAPAPKPAAALGSANNLFNNAFALCSSGKCTDPQKAIEYLNEAIKLKPDYAEAYSNRGIAYSELGQNTRAIEDYNEAIRLKPDIGKAYTNRGIAYSNLGQNPRAIEDYNEAIRLKPDNSKAYNNRGIAYFMQGNNKLGCLDAQKACALGICTALEDAKGKGLCR